MQERGVLTPSMFVEPFIIRHQRAQPLLHPRSSKAGEMDQLPVVVVRPKAAFMLARILDNLTFIQPLFDALHARLCRVLVDKVFDIVGNTGDNPVGIVTARAVRIRRPGALHPSERVVEHGCENVRVRVHAHYIQLPAAESDLL